MPAFSSTAPCPAGTALDVAVAALFQVCTKSVGRNSNLVLGGADLDRLEDGLLQQARANGSLAGAFTAAAAAVRDLKAYGLDRSLTDQQRRHKRVYVAVAASRAGQPVPSVVGAEPFLSANVTNSGSASWPLKAHGLKLKNAGSVLVRATIAASPSHACWIQLQLQLQ